MTDPGTLVHLLRVRAPARLGADAALATARSLGALELRPAGLPSASILCIRTLADPSPGALVLDSGTSIGAPVADAWRLALERRLGELARAAARPADGPVPAGAVAVLFRDRTELLACLAEDRAAHDDAGRWWWRSLARGLPPATAAAWLVEPELVPPVVALLARRGSLGAVLAGVDSGHALAVAERVLAVHGIAASEQVARSVAMAAGGALPPGPSPIRRLLEWTPVPATGSAARSPTAVALASIALSLAGEPALVRAAAAGTTAWRPDPSSRHRRARPWRPDDRPAQGALGADAGSGEHPSSRPRRADTTRARAVEGAGPEAPARRTRAGMRSPAGSQAASAAAPRVGARRVAAHAPPETHPASPVDLGDATMIHTRLGGLFFLLPVASHLGLYADFTRPLGPNLALDPWDFVSLVGTALGAATGADREDEAADPVWRLLTALAGRRGDTRPGVGWTPAEVWRVDAGWLDPFPRAGAWRWSSARGRVRVEHPAGFAVLDVAARAADADAVRLLLRRHVPGLGRLPSLEHGAVRRPAGRDARSRWISELVRYLRPRLGLALGLPEGADPADLVLRRAARVEVADASVTVAMPLDALPLEIRLAGLDRDLGWIPAARRSLSFRFS